VTAPRLEIRLDRIRHNATSLVQRLATRGIGVTGITKATLGSPTIARELLAAGVAALGDSRVENLERLRAAGIDAPLVLVRSPMLSQVDRVVAAADVSLNTERTVLAALSRAATAAGRVHGVVLMVELGDLREGVLPANLPELVRTTLDLSGLELRGIGTNLACQSGAAPDAQNMGQLSALASEIEVVFGIDLAMVSGGNSANLGWALGGGDVGRVDDLRLGEAILLGCEPLHRTHIDGLHDDAFTLVAEVIESKVKPHQAWGDLGQSAFGAVPVVTDAGAGRRVIVALGRQDVDPAVLLPPSGLRVLGASSDHLVLAAESAGWPVGAEVAFGLGYGALLAAMTSPFVQQVQLTGGD
jgi:predicted amino acid racemase